MFGERLRQLRKEKKMTLDDLARALGTSKQTIQRYESGVIANIPPEKIEALASALGTTPSALMGWSDGAAEHSRDIAEKNCNRSGIASLPVLGEIACGKPIFASETRGEYIPADGSLGADFCLRAHGDSMVGARIYDGDIVFIRAQDTVENGEIAAVIINDEATLKRVYFYRREKKLILSPENPKYAPLVYIGKELRDIRILGKAVAFQSHVI